VLLIQIDRREDCEHKQLAIQIIRDCFDEFSKKQYPKIIKKLNISKKLLTETLDFITQLNPKPIFHIVTPDLKTQEIIPDFIITVQGNQLDLQLNNPYIPKLKISDDFRSNFMRNQHNISKEQREEAERFIKENIDEASQFIQALNLRELILYNTMKAIMEKQRSYFLTGDIKNLKPMILKDIAEEVNVDISTISRVSNSKYVQTPYGIIPLKQLFSESIGDGKTSSLEIKELIRELIANEDPQRPYQDDEIQKILTEQGYSIARRTVSKYRKQMNIPVSRLRIKL
jgi:RNA polymerase sigma-54 factor